MTKRKIMFVGDVHGRFPHLHDLIETEHPDAVIVAGDFGYWYDYGKNKLIHMLENPFAVPVYFVDGNHEDHDRLDQLVEQFGNQTPIDVGNNVYYIPRGCVFELFGYNICGAGGAFSVDFYLRKPGISWFPQEQLTEQQVDNLFDTSKNVDIVVSHTCPFVILDRVLDKCRIFGPVTVDNTEKLLDRILTMYNPSMWFFGHWHHFGHFRKNNTKFYLLDMLHDFSTPRNRMQYRIIKEQ